MVANLFADTFAKVFTVDTNSNLPTVQTPPNSTTITSVEFSEVAIAKKISKLRITKSPGPDSITVSLLKKCQCLCQPLKILMEQSFESGTLPLEWRSAVVM